MAPQIKENKGSLRPFTGAIDMATQYSVRVEMGVKTMSKWSASVDSVEKLKLKR